MKNRILLLIGALCLVHSLTATTYYASVNGNGSGTFASPASLSAGLNAIQGAGDTLYLRGGVYYTDRISFSRSGTATARIVIAGYPGETAILDFRQTSYGTRGLQISSSSRYVHVRHLTLRYSGKNNLYNEGSYCLFEDLDIYGSADTGCQMKRGGNNTILNVDSHDNFDYEHYGSSGADFGGNADGFADKQFTGDGNHYIGCRSWNNSDDGWDFFDRVSNSGSETVIENCICYHNGPAEYDMRNHPRYQTDRAWFDQIDGSTITNRYGEEQVVTLQHYPCHGNGNGFKLGGNYSTHNVVVHHCLSVANTVRGFDQNNNFGKMRIYNNTGYDNGIDFGFGNTDGGTLLIRNNISYLSRGGNSASVQTVLANDHNTWNNLSASASDFVSLDTTQILAPRNAAHSLPAMTLLHLAAGSRLIDAGVVLDYTYYGSAPDLGCYETVSGQPVNPDPQPEPEPEPEPVYECREGATPVAYVTLSDPIDNRDRPILDRLRADTSLCVTLVDANTTGVDYSGYSLVIVSPVPGSNAAGILPIRSVTRPRLVLKPWIYKSSVWNWGTPGNTSLDAITITDSTHPVFAGLNSPISVFSHVTSNGITYAESWKISPISVLARTSTGKDVVVEYLDGANTVFTIGVSEYSTADLTADGLRLIHNAVYYLLGRPTPAPVPTPAGLTPAGDTGHSTMILTPAGILIRRGDTLYTLTGQKYE